MGTAARTKDGGGGGADPEEAAGPGRGVREREGGFPQPAAVLCGEPSPAGRGGAGSRRHRSPHGAGAPGPRRGLSGGRRAAGAGSLPGQAARPGPGAPLRGRGAAAPCSARTPQRP